MSLPDENTSMVDGLGQSQLEHLMITKIILLTEFKFVLGIVLAKINYITKGTTKIGKLPSFLKFK